MREVVQSLEPTEPSAGQPGMSRRNRRARLPMLIAAVVVLSGAAVFLPDIPASAGIHAWSAGAIGTMTLAVMTRATRGHTGRALEAPLSTQLVYSAVVIAAVLRIAEKIAANSPTAVQAVKRAVRMGDGEPIEQAVAIMMEAHWRSAIHPDRIDGIRAFNEGREPVFQDPDY